MIAMSVVLVYTYALLWIQSDLQLASDRGSIVNGIFCIIVLCRVWFCIIYGYGVKCTLIPVQHLLMCGILL